MHPLLGILLAFTAMLSWGFGEFFIQKTTRKIGDSRALFWITFFGSVILFPFAYSSLNSLSVRGILGLLVFLAVISTAQAYFYFEALRRGKISVIVPINGLELPVTMGLSVLVLHQVPGIPALVLIGLIFMGTLMAVTQEHGLLSWHRHFLEKGALLAVIGALFLGIMNVTIGVGIRETSPLFTIWFAYTGIAFFSGMHLLLTGQWRGMVSELRGNLKLVATETAFDNIGYLSFAFALRFIQVPVATAIVQSYIIMAVILGRFVNRETLQPHQKWGVAQALGGVLVLAYLTAA